MAEAARSATPPSLELRKQVETFARDLLQLIRGVRTYPPGHPFLAAAGARIASDSREGPAGYQSIGVTPTELVVGGEFLGDAGSRISELAALLHGRMVARLLWVGAASPSEVTALARVLSDRSQKAERLATALAAAGVSSLTLEPLMLDELHGTISVAKSAQPKRDEESRRREMWLRLQGEKDSAQDVVLVLCESRMLGAEGLGELPPSVREAVVGSLLELGGRLDAEISALPEEEREGALAALSGIGRQLSAEELVRLVATRPLEEDLRSSTVSALLRELDADRFVDLLAGIAATEGRSTRRLAGIYRRFAPGGARTAVLPVVRARLASADYRGFTAEVWKTVEDFVLKLEEDPFMGEDYLQALEGLESAEDAVGEEDGRWNLGEDLEQHLDAVYLGLAASGGAECRAWVLERLSRRTETLGPIAALRLVKRTDDVLPGLSDSNPVLLRSLCRDVLATVRDLSASTRDSLIALMVNHEGVLVESCLKALAEEQRIASRKFLVDVLSRFSEKALPALVTRARAGPWYVTRNLVIVLGKRGDRQSLPVLQSLLSHEHPKVRREAARVLEGLGKRRPSSWRSTPPGSAP